MHAEVQAWHHADLRFLKHHGRERRAVRCSLVRDAAAVRIDVERAIRQDRYAETQFAQCRYQEVAPSLELEPPLLVDLE